MSNSFSFDKDSAADRFDDSGMSPKTGAMPDGAMPDDEQSIGKKYEHSGKAPVESLVFAYIVGFLFSATSGVVYCMAVTTVEMILAEIVFLFMFAGGVGYPVGWVARKFKLRSDGHMFLVVIFSATVGLYFCWAFHPYFAVGGDVAWRPGKIYQWAKVLFNKGEYGGWVAILVWIGEIIVVYLMGLGFAYVQVDQPFCESCDVWTEKRESVAFFAHPGTGTKVFRRLTNKDYLALLECIPSNDRANLFLRIDMDMCPSCLQTCTISCKEVSNSINDKGEKEQKEKPVFERLVTSPENLQEIIAAGQPDQILPKADSV